MKTSEITLIGLLGIVAVAGFRTGMVYSDARKIFRAAAVETVQPPAAEKRALLPVAEYATGPEETSYCGLIRVGDNELVPYLKQELPGPNGPLYVARIQADEQNLQKFASPELREIVRDERLYAENLMKASSQEIGAYPEAGDRKCLGRRVSAWIGTTSVWSSAAP